MLLVKYKLMLSFQEVDFSIAPLTSTYGRNHVMDFSTISFYNDYYTLLIRRPAEYNKAMFIKPFSYHVWLALAVTMVFVGLCLALINRFRANKEVYSPLGSVWNALWCTYGCLVYQGRYCPMCCVGVRAHN